MQPGTGAPAADGDGTYKSRKLVPSATLFLYYSDIRTHSRDCGLCAVTAARGNRPEEVTGTPRRPRMPILPQRSECALPVENFSTTPFQRAESPGLQLRNFLS